MLACASAVPAAQVDQAGDLHDVGVLTQAAVGVARGLPGVFGDGADRCADGVGDRVADREVQPGGEKRADQGVGVARPISPHQDRGAAVTRPVGHLGQRPVQHDQVIGGGVTAGVPGPQDRREGLAGVVQPRPERVMAKAALEGAPGAFLVASAP